MILVEPTLNEAGVAYTMAAAGGTLSLGFTGTDGDTASKEGEAMSAAFSTTPWWRISR